MKKLMTLLLSFCLLLSLAACGQSKDQPTDDQKTETSQEQPMDDAAQNPDGEAADGESSGETAAEQTISGVVNRLDDYLVLLDENGEYHNFDYGIDVDPTSLEEGDSVTVTYNGTLDGDETPVAVSIDKTAS